MLEPGARHLLLDALRPPTGYTLDQAVGTTFTLDLLSLMTTPVAFAMFDRQDRNGATIDDPIALLQALRDYASRITIFCQAGMIGVPPQFRSLLVYLEDSVYPVMPPAPDGIFHPKVWYIRFRRPDDGDLSYRLLCLSRNLTFDRSWDTVLRLDGVASDAPTHPELSRFAESLIRMADSSRPLPTDRQRAVSDLGMELSRVRWTLPDGFDHVRFWPLGDDGTTRWPFEREDWRRTPMLVISPFVTPDTLSRLTKRRKGSILLTRPETFDALGKHAVSHLGECLVLSSTAMPPEEERGDGEAPIGTEAPDPAAHQSLAGLHAKTYVLDAGWNAHLWTGSANTTDPAFDGNVEFLVQLTGKKARCGIDATIGDQADRLGLRRLVEPYTPAQDEPVESTEDEKAQWRLESSARVIGSWRYTATCKPERDSQWSVDVRGVARTVRVTTRFDDIAIAVRPVTLPPDRAVMVSRDASSIAATFIVSEQAVTPFFVVTLTSGEHTASFLAVADLENPPAGRKERVLSDLLRNPSDLIRLLLLLLGNIEDALAYVEGTAHGWGDSDKSMLPFTPEALLEPLVRTYARDPERLYEIDRLLNDLQASPEAVDVLPDGWDEIWSPIFSALAEGQRP